MLPLLAALVLAQTPEPTRSFALALDVGGGSSVYAGSNDDKRLETAHGAGPHSAIAVYRVTSTSGSELFLDRVGFSSSASGRTFCPSLSLPRSSATSAPPSRF